MLIALNKLLFFVQEVFVSMVDKITSIVEKLTKTLDKLTQLADKMVDNASLSTFYSRNADVNG